MTDAKAPDLGTFRAKFFIAFGSIGWGVKDAGITSLLLLFYGQVLGEPPALVGLAIGIALVFDAIIDPVIGVISDNWQSRLGRRLPFMYIAALPVGILYYLLWNPPHLSHFGVFFYLLVTAVLVRGFLAMYEIPSTALVPELTTDYAKRTEFLSWRYFLGIMGAVAIGFLSLRYFLVPDKMHPVGQLNPAGYPIYSIVASVIMSATILISCLGLHKYAPHFLKTPPRYKGIGQLFGELKDILALRPFRIILMSGIFAGVAAGLSGGLNNYLLTFYWKLNNKDLSDFVFVGALAVIFTFLVIVPLTKRLEKRTIAIGCSVVAVTLGTATYIPALFGWTPAMKEPWVLPVLLFLFLFLAALAVTALIVTGSMMADVVEYGALKTKRRNEGTLFAAQSFIAKSVSGVGIFISGLILGFAQIPHNALPATIDPHIMLRLIWVYVPILTALHAGAIFSFSLYRITRKEQEENVRRLAEEYAIAGGIGTEVALAQGELSPRPAASPQNPMPAPGE